MAYKTILVHVDDTDRSKAQLDVAIRLALDHQAYLVGAYLVSTPEISPSVAALLPHEIAEMRVREAGAAQHRAEDTFRAATAAAGLSAIEWRAPAGDPLNAAVANGRCADLIVVGQRDARDPDGVFAQELVSITLLASGRPTLVVPYIGALRALGQRVLVAYDGGREATRAIADAMPILRSAKQVNVVTVNADGAMRQGSAQPGSHLALWLERQGVNAQIAPSDTTDISIGEWFLSRAADLGTDLIVMGGYGHTRLRELVLGGVTRTMLETMTVPVLMSH
jgi:nucleotide-binding universal stress UspA family protein